MIKDIKGYKGIYKIDESGVILKHDGTIIYGSDNGNSYKRVGLRKKGIRKKYLIHRLVAETFIQKPNNLNFINHIDGDKLNNHVSNLEWTTLRKNTAHWHNVLRKTNGLPVGVERLPSKKYRSRIMIDGKYNNLGVYNTKEEAGTAYSKKEKALMGYAIDE